VRRATFSHPYLCTASAVVAACAVSSPLPHSLRVSFSFLDISPSFYFPSSSFGFKRFFPHLYLNTVHTAFRWTFFLPFPFYYFWWLIPSRGLPREHAFSLTPVQTGLAGVTPLHIDSRTAYLDCNCRRRHLHQFPLCLTSQNLVLCPGFHSGYPTCNPLVSEAPLSTDSPSHLTCASAQFASFSPHLAHLDTTKRLLPPRHLPASALSVSTFALFSFSFAVSAPLRQDI